MDPVIKRGSFFSQGSKWSKGNGHVTMSAIGSPQNLCRMWKFGSLQTSKTKLKNWNMRICGSSKDYRRGAVENHNYACISYWAVFSFLNRTELYCKADASTIKFALHRGRICVALCNFLLKYLAQLAWLLAMTVLYWDLIQTDTLFTTF